MLIMTRMTRSVLKGSKVPCSHDACEEVVAEPIGDLSQGVGRAGRND